MLPSKYAPGGISAEDRTKPIQVGRKTPKPVEYVIRTVEARVQNAASGSEDIEMVPMEEYNEVSLISDYVTENRTTNSVVYNDPMEVDMDLPGAYIPDDNCSYLVLDTNFVLSHLNIIDEIGKMASQFRLKIVVPIVVIKELDGLKQADRQIQTNDKLSGKTIGHLARWANDWIYSRLADGSGSVIGQKYRQKIDRDAVKDDAILDCCIYFKENFTTSLIVLMSNDKNLCAKALANDILTITFKPQMNSRLICETIYKESVTRFGVLETIGAPEAAPVPQMPAPTIPINDISSACETVYKEVTMIAKSAIKKAMESNFGDDMELLGFDPNALVTLDDCGKTIQRFKVSVFSSYLPKTSFKQGLPTDKPKFQNTLSEFVDRWSEVLKSIYDHEMDEKQNRALQTLIKRWRTMATSF